MNNKAQGMMAGAGPNLVRRVFHLPAPEGPSLPPGWGAKRPCKRGCPWSHPSLMFLWLHSCAWKPRIRLSGHHITQSLSTITWIKRVRISNKSISEKLVWLVHSFNVTTCIFWVTVYNYGLYCKRGAYSVDMLLNTEMFLRKEELISKHPFKGGIHTCPVAIIMWWPDGPSKKENIQQIVGEKAFMKSCFWSHG